MRIGVRRGRRDTHRLWWIITLMLALVLGAAACSTGEPVEVDDEPSAEDGEETTDTGEDSTDDTGGEAEEEAGGGTLTVAISAEPDNLDVHVSTASPTFLVMENVYDTLVEPAPDLSFQPALATDWEVSEDRLTWTFNLREGVTWHNGREFGAGDVVASFERIMDTEVAANAWRFESVEEVREVDDLTVEFALSRPTPNLLANVGGFKGMAIVPPELIESDSLSTEAVGTGPFRFVSYTPGDSIVLEANEDYWGEGPFVDEVEIRFISEPATALTNLRTGEVDITNNVPPQEIPNLTDDADVELLQGPSLDYWYFTCNFAQPPYDDARVRQALSMAVDREQVAQAAFFDAARPTQSAMPQSSFWATDYAPFSFDPDGARALLAEAGAEGLTMDLMLTDEFPHSIQAAQVLESQWADVGVDVSIRTLDFASWLDEQGAGSYDCYVLGWLNNLDGEYGYYGQHHSEGANNFHGYANAEVDALLDEARRTVDEEARRDLYVEAAEHIIDDVSYGYLYIPDILIATGSGVQDFELHGDGKMRLRTVRLDG